MDGAQLVKKKTLQLFQLFLLVFAFYSLLKYTGNQRLLVSLSCLVAVFLVGKVEAMLQGNHRTKTPHAAEAEKKRETRTASQAIDWLLKSKNILLLTDAIQYLLHDLGMIVSPCPDNRAVDRLVRIPGMETTWGITILGDVGEVTPDWDELEDLAAFDKGKAGKRRALVIASNCLKEDAEGKLKYINYSAEGQEALYAKHVVAVTTLTMCKIYLLSKKKGVDVKSIFGWMEATPGGVFQLERGAEK
jgi:hypothetical protein